MSEFLRRLPRALSVELRMELDAIGYAADLIEIAISRLRHSAQFFACDAPSIEENPLFVRAMFLDAWAIVDNAHNMRKLLGRGLQREKNIEGKIDNSIESFLELSSQATVMRNGMDHLSQMLPNLARKKSASALYGALSWVWTTDFDKSLPSRACINMLTTGAFHREGEQMLFANPAGEELEVPFGMFTLNAFDEQINLSKLGRKSEAVREHFNTKVAAQWEREAGKLALEKNIDPEKIKEVAPGSIWFSLAVDFKGVPENGSST